MVEVLGEGDIRYDDRSSGIRLGSLSVGAGAVAYLLHPEHGGIGFGPGNYTISRQREQSEEIRLVQD